MNKSLGMIEVKGLVAAIQIADTMAKVASVTLEKTESTRGFGWRTVFITGDVGAVEAAIQAGQAVANQNSWLVSSNVIPRPANGLESFFEKTTQKNEVIKEEIIQEVEEVELVKEVQEVKVDDTKEKAKETKIQKAEPKKNNTKKTTKKK